MDQTFRIDMEETFAETESREYKLLVSKELRDLGYAVVEHLAVGVGDATFVGALDRTTGSMHTIKVTEHEKHITDTQIHDLEQQQHFIQSLKHPNIIKLYCTRSKSSRVYHVMEEAAGNLQQYVDAGLNDDKIGKYFREIVSAVQYMHSNGIVHRDLKAENVLICNGQAKLTNFEFVRPYKRGDLSGTFLGSPGYMSPEILQEIPYDMTASDIFALGVLLHILIHNFYPFGNHLTADEGTATVLKRMAKRWISCDASRVEEPELNHLRNIMLHSDPNGRPTIDEVAVHPWVKRDVGIAKRSALDQPVQAMTGLTLSDEAVQQDEDYDDPYYDASENICAEKTKFEKLKAQLSAKCALL